jgi:2,4-dienoyl-CoA reductase-like NADH-dependent reductase (Old Yellow Enzyme family)
MYEHLAAFSGGSPNQYHISLYSTWAQGGWGMIITGNCQISPFHLTLGRDLTIPRGMSVRESDPFKALSAAMRSSGVPYAKDGDSPLAIMQLSHSGRQSPRFIGGRLGTFRRPVAPSSRRLGIDSNESWFAKAVYWCAFQTPRTMKSEEVRLLVEDFANAAKFAYETGFDGVQLHAAHGCRLDFLNKSYLLIFNDSDILSQFLSPKAS